MEKSGQDSTFSQSLWQGLDREMEEESFGYREKEERIEERERIVRTFDLFGFVSR